MKWHFRQYAPGEKTRDPIQGEFFATEAIRNPAEALIRESIQNSLDAQLKDDDGNPEEVLRVRLLLGVDKFALSAKRAAKWFEAASPHYQADGNGLHDAPEKNEPCSFLLYEDFHTTGLEGDVTQQFDENKRNPFFYFFRAEGRSAKSETDRGRWGVGKYVFPRSSRVSSVFGLTVRADDGKRLLMGTSVLKSHVASGKHFTPDGYFGEPHKNTDFILPFDDAETLDAFSSDFRLSRRKESGLSVVVPWLDQEFTERQLVEAVVRDYFYPILTGGLCVIIETPSGKVEIDDTTLEDVVLGLDGDTSKELLELVDLGEWAARQKPQDIVRLKPANPERPEWTEALIPPEQLKPLRQKLENGEKFAVRVPLTVREKGAREKRSETYFDVFLQQGENESGRPVFVREGIIISDVRGAGTRARGVRSIVLVEHKALATLLGDSENPAHTQWQKDSSHFKGKYVFGATCIEFVTKSVASLVRLLAPDEEEEDSTLLLDIFSLPITEADEQKTKKKRKKKKGQDSEDDDVNVEPKLKRFRVQKVPGGFTVVRGDAGTKPPAKLDVRVAYDLRRGNPLNKYHPADFKVGKGDVRIEEHDGMKILKQEDNRLLIAIHDPDFRLTVAGFDQKRDLFVNVKLEEEEDDDSQV